MILILTAAALAVTAQTAPGAAGGGAAAGGAPELLNEAVVYLAGDYPTESLVREEQGIVSVVLDVSPKGAVTGCRVTESSGWARLDWASCALARKRSRFKPAQDAAGQPVTGQYRMAAAWWLPGLALQTAQLEVPLQLSRVPQGYRQPVAARLIFNAEGHVTDCTVTTSSGSAAADRAVCAYSRQAVTIAPPRPPAGSGGTVAVRYLKAALFAPTGQSASTGTAGGS